MCVLKTSTLILSLESSYMRTCSSCKYCIPGMTWHLSTSGFPGLEVNGFFNSFLVIRSVVNKQMRFLPFPLQYKMSW